MLGARSAHACKVEFISSPEELVANAELIVLATALDYVGTQPGRGRTTGTADTTVRFRVESVLKGTYAAFDLSLNGYLEAYDDWNDKPAPYTFVRRDGRRGSCFANTYRSGGRFVLMLKRGTNPRQGTTEYTVDWAPLAAVNEQIRSADDPWVQWVKGQIQIQSANTFSVSFRSDSQQFTVVDSLRLTEIQKKMDEIDFWNADKFRRVFTVACDRNSDSQRPEKIEITAVRGTPKSLLFWNSSCPAADDSRPAQELLSLVELIKRAAPEKP
jgi:hypothetical protein